MKAEFTIPRSYGRLVGGTASFQDGDHFYYLYFEAPDGTVRITHLYTSNYRKHAKHEMTIEIDRDE